jgi:hypothetical protein
MVVVFRFLRVVLLGFLVYLLAVNREFFYTQYFALR